jgi:hypothetical protein
LEKLDLAEIDPKRVLYNALVPFAVALLESFFSRCFKILLHCDPEADERIAKQSKKVELNDVIAIKNGTRTIEDIVAEWYSFQNIDSIHRAFSDWFGINFRAIIREPKKSGNKIRLLEHQLNYIVDFRHGIVHRMEVDSQLTKSQVDDIFAAALSIIDAFVESVLCRMIALMLSAVKSCCARRCRIARYAQAFRRRRRAAGSPRASGDR